MGLNPLGDKNVRKIERRTGLPVKWASVNPTGEGKYYWRFWTPVEDDKVRLGVWDLRADTWKLSDQYQVWNEELNRYWHVV